MLSSLVEVFCAVRLPMSVAQRHQRHIWHCNVPTRWRWIAAKVCTASEISTECTMEWQANP